MLKYVRKLNEMIVSGNPPSNKDEVFNAIAEDETAAKSNGLKDNKNNGNNGNNTAPAVKESSPPQDVKLSGSAG